MGALEEAIEKKLLVAAKQELKARGITDEGMNQAARLDSKKKARAVAERIRTITKQAAVAFKAGTLKPVAVPELPVARTIALKQEPPYVRSAVDEEDVADVADWGF